MNKLQIIYGYHDKGGELKRGQMKFEFSDGNAVEHEIQRLILRAQKVYVTKEVVVKERHASDSQDVD